MTVGRSICGAQARLGSSFRALVLGALAATCCHADAAADFLYTVQTGDHPWNIAQRFLKDPSYNVRLSQLNHIINDRRLAPCAQLRIPAEWLKLRSSRVYLLAVSGDIVVRSGTGAARPGVAGEELLAGTSLQTGSKASATFEFEDGSRVLARKDSELRLLQAAQPLIQRGSQVDLELLRGALESTVTPVSAPAGRFEIRSPAAIAAVRGTQFRVSATATQTRTEVLDGAVLVSTTAGQSATNAGSGTLAELGQAPGAPQPLIPAPNLSGLPERFERFPIDWPLPTVAGASAYRTLVASDDRFAEVVSDEISAAPRARALDIADGSYVLRVRGIDAKGIEGLSAQSTLVVHARPEPPLLIEPAPDAVTLSTRSVFRWTRANAAMDYRLEILPNDANTTVAPLEATIAAVQGAVFETELAVGVYRWRVSAFDPARGRQGPWGDSQSFRRALPGPGVEPAQVVAGGVTLRWPVQPSTASYRLQVARDDGFSQLLVDVNSTASQHALDRLNSGTYYVRVQTTAQDGYVGPWGTPQSFSVPPDPPPQHWKAWLIFLFLLIAL